MYGDSSLSISTGEHRSKLSRRGRKSFQDDLPQSGSPTVITTENDALVIRMILSDRRLKSKK